MNDGDCASARRRPDVGHAHRRGGGRQSSRSGRPGARAGGAPRTQPQFGQKRRSVAASHRRSRRTTASLAGGLLGWSEGSRCAEGVADPWCPRTIVVERPPFWSAGVTESWIVRHGGRVAQGISFLAAALVLLLLRASDVTARWTILAFVFCAVANMGVVLGAEGVLPPGLREAITIFSWVALPLAFPTVGLAILHFPNRSPLLERHPAIGLLPLIVIAPILVLAVGTGLYVAGVDAARGIAVWDATHPRLYLRGLPRRACAEHRDDGRRVAAVPRDERCSGTPARTACLLYDAAWCAGVRRGAGPASDRRLSDERPFHAADVHRASAPGADPAPRRGRSVRRRCPPGDGTARRHPPQSSVPAWRATRSRCSCSCPWPLSSSRSSGSGT